MPMLRDAPDHGLTVAHPEEVSVLFYRLAAT
jgi:hypothetical protein